MPPVTNCATYMDPERRARWDTSDCSDPPVSGQPVRVALLPISCRTEWLTQPLLSAAEGGSMATEEPEQDNALSKVARSVGSALGTVASKVNGVVGDKADAKEKSEGNSAESPDTDTKSSERSEGKSTKA